MEEGELRAQIAALEAQLADLKARLPAHSIPPAMIAALDEIDEQLVVLRAELRTALRDAPGAGQATTPEDD